MRFDEWSFLTMTGLHNRKNRTLSALVAGGVALGLLANDGLCQRLQIALGLLPLLPFNYPLLQPWLGVRRQGIAGLK